MKETHQMREIIVNTFLSLDGVMQAPGGPGEDPAGGFELEGWSVNYWDDLMGQRMDEIMGKPTFDLLLGRKTYEIFAAHWPHASDDQGAGPLNKATKYVVTTTLDRADWQPSRLIKGDVVPQIQRLKEQGGPELQVHGSSNLLQTLMKHELVDRYNLMIFPLLLGPGSASSETAPSPPASASSTARPPPRASSWPPTRGPAPSPPDRSRWSSQPNEESNAAASSPIEAAASWLARRWLTATLAFWSVWHDVNPPLIAIALVRQEVARSSSSTHGRPTRTRRRTSTGMYAGNAGPLKGVSVPEVRDEMDVGRGDGDRGHASTCNPGVGRWLGDNTGGPTARPARGRPHIHCRFLDPAARFSRVAD